MKKLMLLAFLPILASCDIPPLFWEQEGRKVVDDVVDEEEKLHPIPAPVAQKDPCITQYKKQKQKIVKRSS